VFRRSSRLTVDGTARGGLPFQQRQVAAGTCRLGDTGGRKAAVLRPLDPATRIGPLVSERQRHRVESYIAKGKADGGRITTGGRRPEGFERGWFVEPTIFAGVDPKATIAQKEIFGPVLAVIPYADEQEAVAIANADFRAR